MKKSTSFLMFLFCFTALVFAQENIAQSTLSTSGGSITNNQGYTLDWTAGTPFRNTIIEDFHLTEGFQQGIFPVKVIRNFNKETELDIIDKELVNSNANTSKLTFHSYPNPTKNQLYIAYDSDETDQVSIIILDQVGKSLWSQKAMLEPNTRIQVNGIDQLQPGHYFIQVIPSKTPSQTLAFIKI